jgi:hypothetical protein
MTTLIKRDWIEDGGLATTLSCEDDVPEHGVRVVAIVVDRADTIRIYQQRGYSYRNIDAVTCQLWKQIDDCDSYHVVRLSAEEVVTK